MIVDNFLLPRFLVLELVLACHLFQFAQPCLTTTPSLGLKKRSLEGVNCTIPLNSWTFPPLILDENRDWLLPDSKSTITVAAGSSVILACPAPTSGKNKKRSAGGGSDVSLLCSQTGLLVDVQQAAAELSQLGCTASPADSEQLVAGGRCGPQQEGQLVDIGFQLSSSGGHFRPVITVCHVAETEATLFARHTIRGNYTRDRIRGEASGRPAFREGGLFYRQVRAAQAYAKQSQQQMFTRLFGPQQAAEYFTNNHYLAKGHLAPDADFYFKDWQEASYYYSNTAPQWQSVNNGNWKDVEYTVRKLARETGRDLQIWTGTLGLLQLPSNGSQVEVYLTENQGKKYIPVPAYFWKVVLDPVRVQAVVLVTANNPHLSRLPRSTAFCKDRCQDLGWDRHLNNKDKAESGLTFCCSPADFAAAVAWAGPPDLATWPPLHF